MQCPACRFEPRDRLLHKPCPECRHIWVDTESYVMMAASDHDVDSALDIGCGNKGIIAQYYWENVNCIRRGYACDIHVIKDLPPLWQRLKIDAATLEDHLGMNGVDFTTHCGMLEHVEYAHALEVLHVVERVTKLGFFSSCSSVCREVDYKVKRDGNPFHYYRSWWTPEVFEALGYTVDRRRMLDNHTFIEEIPFGCNFVKSGAALPPWAVRKQKVIDILCARRCYVPGCNREPVGWTPFIHEGEHIAKPTQAKPALTATEDVAEAYGGSFCFEHAPLQGDTPAEQIKRWLQNPELLSNFPRPPWREEKLEI